MCQSQYKDMNKVTIIGAGMVGSSIAYSLVLKDTTEQVAIIDLNEKLARAQVMDLQHAAAFSGKTVVKVGSYEDCADSAITIVTCGAAQKDGQTRLDLVKQNTAIIKEIVPQIFAQNPDSIVLMVTNPVDVLTYVAQSLFPEHKNQIIGSGTVLDSARLRHLLGEELAIDPRSIHAYIVGEHGDSELPLWSAATIGGVKLGMPHVGSGICENLSDQRKKELFDAARNAAYAIIEGKQATYHGIGAAAEQIARAILYDKRTVLPVSHAMEGDHGLQDVCLSMPAVVGRGGVVGRLCADITDAEREQLQMSAQTLRTCIDKVL
jgi:L-lactate dehydrogenase